MRMMDVPSNSMRFKRFLAIACKCAKPSTLAHTPRIWLVLSCMLASRTDICKIHCARPKGINMDVVIITSKSVRVEHA